MQTMLSVLAGAAANAATATAGNSGALAAQFDPLGIGAASVPEWLMFLVGGGIGMALIHVLRGMRDNMAKPGGPSKKEFVRMLCDQVWQHTDTMTDVFAQRMRLQPEGIEQLRALVRMLREDLSRPLNFIEQMRAHAPQAWPKLDLYQAFNNWSGQIKSIESQLADLHRMITYPMVRDPVDKRADETLIYQYKNEQAFLSRAIDRLRSQAFELCAAAKAHLADKKHKSVFGSHDDDDDEHEHPDCPCCRKREGDHRVVRVEAPIELPPRPPAPPPPPPPPAPAACQCATPRMCQCARCTCCCTCRPAPAPSAAKA